MKIILNIIHIIGYNILWFFKSIPLYIKNIINKLFTKKERDFLSIVAIIKNEAPYIEEWIEYHLLVGVDKFYIYDNESEDELLTILQPYINEGIVIYKYFPGYRMQRTAYKEALATYRYDSTWIAFIDCDEFIAPIATETLPEFLKDFKHCAGVEINWMIYGSSGHKNKTKGLVIERFKDHAKEDFEINKHVKSIVNPRLVLAMQVHHADYIFRYFHVNTNRIKTKKVYIHRPPILDKIRVNHYFGKSYEEFLEKRARGMADNRMVKVRPIENFHVHDKNEIKNDPLMDKYIPLIYENLAKRKA